jgi:hypothetical protein
MIHPLNFRRFYNFIFIIIILIIFGSEISNAQQVRWVVGGKMGFSVADSEVGFQFGPMGEVLFSRNLAVGSEFNINSQAGTPVEWANYFKYYIDAQGSQIKPYVNGGFSLFFYTGGPYFAIRFGGGANFPVAPNLYIPADLQFGPVFATGYTVFYFAITSGIRYYIPAH